MYLIKSITTTTANAIVITTIMLSLLIGTANGNVIVANQSYPMTIGRFGVHPVNYQGYLTVVVPSGGCHPIVPVNNSASVCLIERNEKCTFIEKAINAESGGCQAVIIYDNIDENLIYMGGSGSGYDIGIPVVFVSEQTGLLLLTQNGRDIIINNQSMSNMEIDYAVFSILILILIMIVFTIVCTRIYLCHRRRYQNRNSYTQLTNVNSCPQTDTGKWFISTSHMVSQYPADSDDLCSICLTNFKKNVSVRTLVCDHVFHKQCIELWLLKNWRCPNCNWDPRISKK